MDIILTVVPQKEQRYKTVGDWFARPDGTVEVRSSKLSDPRLEFLILVHELVEFGLCHFAGITQKEVDQFDMEHQDEQELVELGDLKQAPYRKQHCIATAVERLLAAELGVVWIEYEAELLDLHEERTVDELPN